MDRRVVFDTVVFVRSLLNRNSLWARLIFAHAEAYQLVVSPPLLREIVDVLQRPELVRRFTTLPGRDPAAILGLLRSASVVTIDLASFTPVARDPKDDMVLATAVAGNVDYLVSEDKDLLDLGAYAGIPIIDAATFLQLLSDGS